MTALAFPYLGDFSERWLSVAGPTLVDTTAWTPCVAVREDDHQVTLELDLPGIKAEDLEIKVAKNQLTVRGERKWTVEQEQYRRVESHYGSFTRTFQLRSDVAQQAIAAELKAGVLTLRLPKREETKPRAITIDVKE